MAHKNAKIYISDGPIYICTQKYFRTNQKVVFSPEPGSDVSTADIHVTVNNNNILSMDSEDEDKKDFSTFKLGKKNVFFGIVRSAGSIRVRKASQIHGQFIGKSVRIGKSSVVTLDTETNIDIIPPMISGVDPVDGSTIDSDSPLISAQFSDNISVDASSVMIELDNVDISTLSTVDENGFTYQASLLSDGEHTLFISISDTSGNMSESLTTFDVSTDVIAPTVSNILPANNSEIGNNQPNISADFSDDVGVDVGSIIILLNGNDITNDSTVTEFGFSYTPASGLADGIQNLQIDVQDTTGNLTQEVSSFVVDTTMPFANVLVPADGSLLGVNTPQFQGNYSDVLTGIDVSSVEILLDGLDISNLGTVDENGFDITAVDPLVDGDHTLTLNVSDNVMNQATVDITFATDVSPPSISNLDPVPNNTIMANLPVISASFDDNFSGIDIDSAIILVDGIDVTINSIILETGFTFTPALPLANGNHSVDITISDIADNTTNTAYTFNVLIDFVPPVISNVVPVDNSIIFDVQPTVSAVFSDDLSGINSNATIILLDGVNVTATANANQFGFSFVAGPLTFSVHTLDISITDGTGNLAQSITTFTVQTQPPVANDDAANTDEDQDVVIDVLTNDTDDGTLDVTSVVITTPATNGTAVASLDGTVTYTPNANFNGNDSFAYTVNDDQGATSNPATVDVTVNAVNDLPVANADASSTEMDQAVVISVLTNDTDIDGTLDVTSVIITTPATNGTAIANADGTVTYTPNVNFSGNDSFDYTVNDNLGGTSNEANVSVAVVVPTIVSGIISTDTTWTLANSPYKVVGHITVNPGVTLTIEAGVLVKFDGNFSMTIDGLLNSLGTLGNEVLFTSNQSSPALGDWQHIQINNSANVVQFIKVEYADRGVYIPGQATIQNSILQFNNNGVYFEPNTGPGIFNNTIINNTNGIFAGCNVFTGCSPTINNNSIYDNSFNILVFSYSTNASNVVINATNNWWNTTDVAAIAASIFDNEDDSNLGVVNIIPILDGPGGNPVVLPPVANDDAIIRKANQTVVINILGNDAANDGVIDVTSVAITTAATNGVAVVNVNGTVTYTPNANFNGNDSFEYTVNNTQGTTSNAATVDIIANVDADANLVAYYPFNGNANDESGNGINGTVNGATLAPDRFGGIDSAYSFDGSNSIIMNADNLPTGERTVSLWFYTDDVSNNPVFLGYGGGGSGQSWIMQAYNSTNFFAHGHFGINIATYDYGSQPVGQWHHFVITTALGTTKMYVDGAEVSSNANFINNTVVAGKQLSLGVGVDANGISPFTNVDMGYVNGLMDDVRIYDRAISSIEVQSLFAFFPTDVLPPMVVNLVPAEGAILSDATPTLSADFNDNFSGSISGVDVSSVQILLNSNDITSQSNVTEAGFSHTPVAPLAIGNHTLEVNVIDNAGNLTSVQRNFSLENTAPVVNVGENFAAFVIESVNLNALVTDDGLPSGSVTYLWSQQTGPGTATFFDSSSAQTSVTFSDAGEYILRLDANDGLLNTFDEVSVTIYDQQWNSKVIGYQHDALNRLITVTEPDSVTTYTYDKAGNREQETVTGTVTP